MKIRLIVLLFLLMAPFAYAQETINPFANFAPTPYPDRVMLTIPGDPATTLAVTWRTVAGMEASIGEILPVDNSPRFSDRVTSVNGTRSEWEKGNTTSTGHRVIFSQLQPNTHYMYRVGDGTHWSEWFQTRTAEKEANPFSFIYLGDFQNDIKSLGSRALRKAYGQFPDARFMVMAGDLVNRSTEADWREYFYAGGWLLGSIPSLPTPGNHEYQRDENQVRTFSPHWQQIFTMPTNGPSEKFNYRSYFVDYQGVRFVSLDSPGFEGNEAEDNLVLQWLEATLASNPHRWTILFTHYPIYSCSYGRSSERYRMAVQPLLEKYNVDLVLTGHDHTYCRGMNEAGVLARNKNLPVYVVSVAGPKMYALNATFWSDRVASMTQLYQHISVSSGSLDYKAYSVDGQLYDHFVIDKDAAGVNRFTEGADVKNIPVRAEIPENYRSRYSAEELDQYQKIYLGK